MKNPEKDLSEFLFEEGYSELGEIIKKYQKNIIKVCSKENEKQIAIGESKLGGYPDLPSEIPYPIMSGYTTLGNEAKHYEKSAMQLVAQINLSDIADCDSENLLPHTGMLYFFWSGEIMPIHEMLADDLDNLDYHKVIWFNGDLSMLKRTKPSIPYYSKYFTKAFDEKPIYFVNAIEYEDMCRILDEEHYDLLIEIAPNYDIESHCYNSNKMFGYPSGANAPYLDNNEKLLFQYDYGVGSLWNIFWLISDDDLRKRDFSKATFSEDMD